MALLIQDILVNSGWDFVEVGYPPAPVNLKPNSKTVLSNVLFLNLPSSAESGDSIELFNSTPNPDLAILINTNGLPVELWEMPQDLAYLKWIASPNRDRAHLVYAAEYMGWKIVEGNFEIQPLSFSQAIRYTFPGTRLGSPDGIHYKFEETSGNVAISSTNVIGDGTYQGTYSLGVPGRFTENVAVEFGADGYINYEGYVPFSGNSARTMIVSFKARSLVDVNGFTQDYQLMRFGSPDRVGEDLHLAFGSKLIYSCMVSGSTILLEPHENPIPDSWNLLIFVYEQDGNWRYYLNDRLIKSGKLSLLLDTVPGGFQIGYQGETPTVPDGLIFDEVAALGSAITSKQAQMLLDIWQGLQASFPVFPEPEPKT